MLVAGAALKERHVQVLLGLTLVGAALRFGTLDLQSFHHDETVTAGRVLQPGLLDMLEMVRDSERSGPLYYVSAWLWSKPFGLGEIGLRSLSALFGTLTVPIAFLAGRDLVSRRAGLVAAALVAVNPYLVWYSQEARSYALLVLLIGLSLYLMARATERPATRELTLWAIAVVAAVATHYFALFLVVPQAAWLLHAHRDRRTVAALGAAATGALALLPLAVRQSENGSRNLFVEDSLSARVLEGVAKFSSGEETSACAQIAGIECAGVKLGAVAAVLAAAGIALLVARGGPSEKPGGLLAAAIGACGLATPLILAVAGVDLFNVKNLIGALVPLLVGVGAGFGARATGRLGYAGAAALSVVFLVGWAAVLANPALQREDWRGVAEAIAAGERPRLVVAPVSADDPLALYLDAEIEKVRASVATAGQERSRADQVTAREIVVVTATEPGSPPAPGFELAGSDPGDEYDVYTYRAPTARTVTVSDVGGEELVGPNFAVLLQKD